MPISKSNQRVFTNPKEIAAACRDLTVGQEMRITFKPITDRIWLSPDKSSLVCADAEDIPATLLPKLVQNVPIEGKVDGEYSGGPSGDQFTMTIGEDTWGDDMMIGVSPKHIETLVLGPAPFVPDGMDHGITVTDKNIRISGDQGDVEEIGKAEALNILRTLAERFKCKVTVSSKSVALIPATKPVPAAADPKVKKMAAPAPVKLTTATQIAGAVKPYIDAKGSKGKFAKGTFIVKFKPITDPCWRRDNGNSIATPEGSLRGPVLAGIVDSKEFTYQYMEPSYISGYVYFIVDGNSSAHDLSVAPDAIAELTIVSIESESSGRTSEDEDDCDDDSIELDGISHDAEWGDDNGLTVGCQDVTPQGVMEIFLMLANFLGYSIDIAGIAKSAGVKLDSKALARVPGQAAAPVTPKAKPVKKAAKVQAKSKTKK